MIPRPSVKSLFFFGSPSHISGFIIPVIVDSIKGAVRRPWPHIRVKGLKAFKPLAANLNSPTAIIEPRITIGVCATSLHILPNLVFGDNALPAVGRGTCTMLEASGCDQFPLKAPAACAVSGCDSATSKNLFYAAIASAKEIVFLAIAGTALYHCQAPVAGSVFHSDRIAEYKDMFQSESGAA